MSSPRSTLARTCGCCWNCGWSCVVGIVLLELHKRETEKETHLHRLTKLSPQHDLTTHSWSVSRAEHAHSNPTQLPWPEALPKYSDDWLLHRLGLTSDFESVRFWRSELLLGLGMLLLVAPPLSSMYDSYAKAHDTFLCSIVFTIQRAYARRCSWSFLDVEPPSGGFDLDQCSLSRKRMTVNPQRSSQSFVSFCFFQLLSKLKKFLGLLDIFAYRRYRWLSEARAEVMMYSLSKSSFRLCCWYVLSLDPDCKTLLFLLYRQIHRHSRNVVGQATTTPPVSEGAYSFRCTSLYVFRIVTYENCVWRIFEVVPVFVSDCPLVTGFKCSLFHETKKKNGFFIMIMRFFLFFVFLFQGGME